MSMRISPSNRMAPGLPSNPGMSVTPSRSPAATAPAVATTLLPLMAVVLAGFLVSGLALPAMPLHVHHGLGLGTVAVGLVAGTLPVATLLSRPWAGRHADRWGARRTVLLGLPATTAAGLLFLLSLQLVDAPAASIACLLLGQALLGGAGSLVIMGAQSWGLVLVGAENVGKVLAWMGTALYAAYAVGAPAGTALYAAYGFAAIALAVTALPLAALALVAQLRPVAPQAHARPAFLSVVRAVSFPGLGLALSGVGFGAITAFVVLLFADRGWNPVWPGITVFAVAFILARVVLGHLADLMGGAKIALIFVVIEAAGLALIWLASWPGLALLGASLTGFGYSLVYPAFGVEAVRRAPPESRGFAMGAYTVFFDMAQGIGTPALGLVASGAGLGAVFLVSALVVLTSSIVAMRLLWNAR
jgi:MFS family permease